MSLARRAAELLGARLLKFTVMAGGDLSEVVELELEDGRRVVAKGGPAPAVEAEMLRALRGQGVAAPAVLAHDQSILVLERLPTRGSVADAWHDLGAVIGRLHRGSAAEAAPVPRYGWHADYAFREVAIENTWTGNWAEFWAERRLASQLRYLPAPLAARLEALAGSLGDRLPEAPPVSLLHGDLWSGNVLVADRRISGLIDPACYYGDAEVDLAMLHLFADPSPVLLGSYGPVPPGSAERRPIYQLWPALVHLRLFGSGYRGLVERLLDQAGV